MNANHSYLLYYALSVMLEDSDQPMPQTKNALALGIAFILIASIVLGSGTLGQESNDLRTDENTDTNSEDAATNSLTGVADSNMRDGIATMDFAVDPDSAWIDCVPRANNLNFAGEWTVDNIPVDFNPVGEEPRATGLQTMQSRPGNSETGTADNDANERPTDVTIRPMPADFDFNDMGEDCASFGQGMGMGFGLDSGMGELVSQMCNLFIEDAFISGLGEGVELHEDGTMTITTIDGDAIVVEELSAAAVEELSGGLYALVDSCNMMMMMLMMNGMGQGMPGMGQGMPGMGNGGLGHGNHGGDCFPINPNFNDEGPVDEEPRATDLQTTQDRPSNTNPDGSPADHDANDRRAGERNPCMDWEFDWDEDWGDIDQDWRDNDLNVITQDICEERGGTWTGAPDRGEGYFYCDWAEEDSDTSDENDSTGNDSNN